MARWARWARWARIFGAELCLFVMLICGYMLYSGQLEAKRGNDAYEAVRSAAKTGAPEMTEIGASASGAQAAPEPGLPVVDFGELKKINPDIIAWIYSPGTPIDYPVTLGRDNQYYLKRMYDGSYNENGCIFLDFRNSPDFMDKNSVIYGHHMKTEAMFSTIEGYKEQSYFEEHPVMYLITETENYRVEMFAGVVRQALDVPLAFISGQDFINYAQSLRGISTFNSDVELTENDRILTLFTCVYDFNDARYILVGKLVPMS